ncbi:protein TIPIN homolog [Anopheles marshallii]|uniref:protein TIPIN homolog n=1 Tax=Anopheles marshallii TaxID=1521116 RepID=UPI00237AE912|nr:protein TIPIN homolog [Anopheles marshallii]
MNGATDYLFSESGVVEDENDGVIPSDDELPDVDDEADHDNEAAGPSKLVKMEVKKKTVKNPRNLLNEAKLCGPRGIIALKDHFKDFKFHGKGHEASDLNRLMRHYEHWAHRLYPKFHFDDCMAKIEKLGHRKLVQMYMNKYRSGLLQRELDEATAVHSEDEPDEQQMNQPLDPLDSMLEEQIARSRGRTSLANTSGVDNISVDTTFDAIRQDKINHQSTDSSFHANALKDAQQTIKSPPAISEELRAKIEANRLKALELRKARMLSLSQSANETENTENDASALRPLVEDEML